MKKLKNRLVSRRGASLLFAMLVFLLCALAGTAALTAASANSGKYAHMREDQRKYLAVSSAVELMKDQLTNSRFIATLETTEVTTYREWPVVSSASISDVTAVPEKTGFFPLAGDSPRDTFLSGVLKSYFLEKAIYLIRGEGGTETEQKATLTLALEGLPNVTVEVTAADFEVTMIFYIPDGERQTYYTALTVAGNSVLRAGEPTVGALEESGGTLSRTTTRQDEFIVTWDKASVVVTATRPEGVEEP